VLSEHPCPGRAAEGVFGAFHALELLPQLSTLSLNARLAKSNLREHATQLTQRLRTSGATGAATATELQPVYTVELIARLWAERENTCPALPLNMQALVRPKTA